jgi:PelA/Pel-15E family pectate lyase
MKRRLLILACIFCAPASAAIIGINQPAPSITAERIAKLPPALRAAWRAYLTRSEAQRAADKAALAAERVPGTPVPPPPPENARADSMPLDRDDAWYATPEARHVADNIVSFQTPAGGWGKNQDRSGPVRQKGQDYVPNNVSQFLTPGDFDKPKEPEWNYVGTLDNNATTTELRFLDRVIKAGAPGEAYRESFVRGVRYLLAAQFPNGGWPQVWPLEGGYHDAVTYNDDAVTLAAQVLTAVGENKGGDYRFVPAALRRRSAAAAKRALDCILATQIVAGGKRTVWAQQYDALTLAPVSARNFEPPALSSEESADLLEYLMSLPHPSPRLVATIRAGAWWLKDEAVFGEAWSGRDTAQGRELVAQQGAGPIWPRYIDAATGRAEFGDRDKTLHDDVGELTRERRNGYNWYNTAPVKTLQEFESWSAAHR